MNNIDKVLSTARAEIGVKESPANSNNVKYNTWYYGRPVNGRRYAWCVVFIDWVFNQCGLSEYFYGGKHCASCTTLMNFYKNQGKVITKDYKAGDLILFQFDEDKYPDHIGILDHVDGNKFYVIEGNTSLSSNDNGGSVMLRERSGNLIMCGIRLFAEEAKPTPKPCNIPMEILKIGNKSTSVKVLQALLNLYGAVLTVDGIFGKGTLKAVKDFQSSRNLQADGDVGQNTWTELMKG